MSHGLPLATWAAQTMGTPVWRTTGLSYRALSTMAGNSMHIVSAPQLCFLLGILFALYVYICLTFVDDYMLGGNCNGSRNLHWAMHMR